MGVAARGRGADWPRMGRNSATKTGKVRENGRKRENWEENGNLVPADGKGWLRPWPLAGAIP